MFNCTRTSSTYKHIALCVVVLTAVVLSSREWILNRRILPAQLSIASFRNKHHQPSSFHHSNDKRTINNTDEWQCELQKLQVNGSSWLSAQELMNDTARNGTSLRNSSLNYNDFSTCQEIGKRLQPHPSNNSVLVHVFSPFGNDHTTTMDERKKHLLILSFLATQCSATSQLVVWYRQQQDDDNTIPTMLLSMPPHLRKRIHIQQFGIEDIENMNLPTNTTQRLVHEWQHAHLAGTTDVARVVILYNHGGMWIDSDVLLLRNLSPLANLNFVYQAQQHVLNGAIMGTSTKQSTFIRSMIHYMDVRLQEYPNNTSYFKWAHTMFNNIAKEGGDMPFSPGCLVDGAWFTQQDDYNSQPTAVGWDAFFTRRATELQVQYIDPTIARYSGPLAYHWHGRWNVSIVDGSLADRADVLYRTMLGIPLHNDKSSSSNNTTSGT